MTNRLTTPIKSWVNVFFIFCFWVFTHSAAQAQPQSPLQGQLQADQALEIEGTAWLLFEPTTQSIVISHRETVPLPPASITKLMTNYVLFSRLQSGDLSMGDKVPISTSAWRAEGSRMFAEVGSQLELGELLRSSIVQSGNDAAIALAEFAGGTELAFAQMMNQTARDLGLTQSNFANSSGLPAEDHLMSALDIAKLSKAIIDDFPEFYTWYAEKEYTHNNIRQFNRNRLLWQDDSVDGLKTGYTEAAGYCLVGTALRKGQRWIAVVMGSSSEKQRSKDVLSLLNFGFNNYEIANVIDTEKALANMKIYGGDVDQLELNIQGQGSVLVSKSQRDQLTTQLDYPEYVQAPIEAGQVLGTVKVLANNQVISEWPLTASQAVSQGSWWKRLSDSVKLRARTLFAD